MLDPHTAAELDLDQIWAAHRRAPRRATATGCRPSRASRRARPAEHDAAGRHASSSSAAARPAGCPPWSCGDAARRAGRPCAITVVESSQARHHRRRRGHHRGVPPDAPAPRHRRDASSCARPTPPSSTASATATGAGVGYTYDGPIDDPHLVVRRLTAAPPSSTSTRSPHGRPVAETHLFQYLMERRKSPFGLRRDGRRVAARALPPRLPLRPGAGRRLPAPAGRAASP